MCETFSLHSTQEVGQTGNNATWGFIFSLNWKIISQRQCKDKQLFYIVPLSGLSTDTEPLPASFLVNQVILHLLLAKGLLLKEGFYNFDINMAEQKQ